MFCPYIICLLFQFVYICCFVLRGSVLCHLILRSMRKIKFFVWLKTDAKLFICFLSLPAALLFLVKLNTGLYKRGRQHTVEQTSFYCSLLWSWPLNYSLRSQHTHTYCLLKHDIEFCHESRVKTTMYTHLHST